MKQSHAQITQQYSTGRSFKDAVCLTVGLIPPGRIMTYGQIAALCGSPGAARVVGQIAHFGPTRLPWHRVVNAKGGLASGYVPGGRIEQACLLQLEGVELKNGIVNVQKYIWWPDCSGLVITQKMREL